MAVRQQWIGSPSVSGLRVAAPSVSACLPVFALPAGVAQPSAEGFLISVWGRGSPLCSGCAGSSPSGHLAIERKSRVIVGLASLEKAWVCW